MDVCDSEEEEEEALNEITATSLVAVGLENLRGRNVGWLLGVFGL